MNTQTGTTGPFRLGIDTGGTYTDAALIDRNDKVVSVAKALTTHHDLARGIEAAIDAVLDTGACSSADIASVGLSTTLATNSIVERKGDRVALVAVGFSERDLDRQGLRDALSGDPVVRIAGGHDSHGSEVEPVDLDGLSEQLRELRPAASAFAVAARFATRNPDHEIAVRDSLRSSTGQPVTCSHELSARLNGPRRAVTAVLNARLIGVIDELVRAGEALLERRGIGVPLIIVRGDGSLISAEQARLRPVETILSGPATSVVAASWLTGKGDAIVSDIGGTTTDVATLDRGRPGTDPQGATVGGFRTMVEAIAVRTTGLGGDSEGALHDVGMRVRLALGPRRAIPVSLLAMEWRDAVHDLLDRQLEAEFPDEHAGRFVLAVPGRNTSDFGLNRAETVLLDRVGQGVADLATVAKSRKDVGTLDRLIARGHLLLSCATPSDAWHVTGQQSTWDAEAAKKALSLFARRRRPDGQQFAESAQAAAELISAQLIRDSAEFLMECAYAWDAKDFGHPPDELARHVLTTAGLDRHGGHVRLRAGLDRPLVALGGPAATCYEAVGERLSTSVDVPEFASAANAIGAVVGQVAFRALGQVSSLGQGRYRVHAGSGMEEVATEQGALDLLESWLRDQARSDAISAGIAEPVITVEHTLARVGENKDDTLLQAEMIVEATGRPNIGHR